MAKIKDYTSSSEFDLETRVQITNEVPLTRNYDMMHHSLQNDTWKWLIGTENVDYDVPYSEVTKTVNGVKAKTYGQSTQSVWNSDKKEYTTVEPKGTHLEIEGVLSAEHDLFLHEIYRYFNCIFPDHPDWLNLLTKNEVIDIIDNAAAQVDYKPNNEFFRIVAESLDIINVDDEEFKLNIRNLMDNTERRKYYGSILGYRMYMHDVLENVLVLPVEKVYPFKAVSSVDVDSSTVDLDSIDERYETSFRKIDWLGKSSDLSFLKSKNLITSGYVLPDKPNLVLEFASATSGSYTLSDYSLYKSKESYSFYSLSSKDEDFKGIVSDTFQSNIIEEANYGLYASVVFPDDKLYGFTSAGDNPVYYNTAYKILSYEKLADLITSNDLVEEHTTYLPPFKDGSLTQDADKNWLFNLFYVLSKKIDKATLMSDFSFVYNPFVKNTIILSLDEMLKMYDTDIDFDQSGVVKNKDFTKVSLDNMTLHEGDLVSFTDYTITGSTPYKVLGGSYGYIEADITPFASAEEYQSVTSVDPFSTKNNDIHSDDNYGMIVTTSEGSKIVMYGQLQFTWEDTDQYVYASKAKLYIRAIPETKSDQMFSYLYDKNNEYEKGVVGLKEEIRKLKNELSHQKEVIASQLYNDKLLDSEAAANLIDEYEVGSEEARVVIKEMPSYEDYKNVLDQLTELEDDLADYENKKRDLCENRSLILNGDLVSNISIGNDVEFFQIGPDSVAGLHYILDHGKISFITFGNISIYPVYPDNTSLPVEMSVLDDKTITFCKPLFDKKLYDNATQQLYGYIRDDDASLVFKPTVELTMYNETTFDVSIQVYVDKSSFAPVYEVQFLSDDAKKKFDSVAVGSVVTGDGISAGTYVKSKNAYTAVLSESLPANGYVNLTFTCPVTSSPDSVLQDPFEYKKLLYSKDTYKALGFFDKGLYGTLEWPSVSKAVIQEDEKPNPQILMPSSFFTVVKHLYSSKLSETNKYLLPSLVSNSNDLFIELNARRLFHKVNRTGDTLNLCNVEWLDYLQNSLTEIGLAKENVNVGFNVTMSTDTSGYTSLVNPTYTDEDLHINFQTFNWNSSTVPAYAQIGTGGSGMSSLFKVITDINYPVLYGAAFYDKSVSLTTDDNDNLTSNWSETDDTVSVKRRTTYSSTSESQTDSSEQVVYTSIDNPLFEIPLNEYNVNLNYNNFTTIDFSFYEQNFCNLLIKKPLEVIKHTNLTANFLDGKYRSVTSIKTIPMQDDSNNNYYYLSDGLEDAKSGEFYLFDSVEKKNFIKYSIYCGGCVGQMPYYKNNGTYYITNSSYYSTKYDPNFENVINFKRSLSLEGKEQDENASYDNLLKRLLVIQTAFIFNSSVNEQYDISFIDSDAYEYQSTNEIIRNNKALFKNRLILFTYFKGSFDKENDDLFGLKDFDTVGLLWNKNNGTIDSAEVYDVDLVRINKNYTFCTNDIINKPDNIQNTDFNLFFGYNKYPLYTPNKDATEFTSLDLSNSIINYSSSIVQSVQLPRKFINEGSYDINIILDPQFVGEGYLYDSYIKGDISEKSKVKYNISQSPFFYDSVNSVFYTNAKIATESNNSTTWSQDDYKIAVNFEENKYFKNLKILYGSYILKNSQKEGSTAIDTTAYIEGILGESFDVTDVKNRDLFVYGEEVNLRSSYMSSLESSFFDTSLSFEGEIYGVTLDGHLVIGGKRNKDIDKDIISFIDAMYPASVTETGAIEKRSLGNKVDFNISEIEPPAIAGMKILSSMMSSYADRKLQNFIYFKNLLVFEGLVNLASPSVIEAPADDDGKFTSVLEHINSGDLVADVASLSAFGVSTHTVATNIKEKCRLLCFGDDKLVAITSSGKVYEADADSLGAASSISFVENENTVSSSDEILDSMYDSTEKSWVFAYGLQADEQGVDFYGDSLWRFSSVKNITGETVYDREFTTSNTAEFVSKSSSNNLKVYTGKVFQVNDSLASSDRVTAAANVKPEDVAVWSYFEQGATEADKEKYGPLYIDKGDYALYKDIKEGPYLVDGPDDNTKSLYERVFSDGDISVVLMQNYLFVYTKCYKTDNDGNYLNELTAAKHWKGAKVPLLLDNTRIKLESFPVEGTNSAYDYVKDSFTEFCSWALDTATPNSDGTYSFSGLELKDKFTKNELDDYKAALVKVRDELLSYEDFSDRIECYSGETQIDGDYSMSGYAVTKVRVSTGLPLAQDLRVDSKASYVIESSSPEIIVKSKPYTNIVNKEALYYDYLYAALVHIRGDREYDSFGAASISEMFTANNRLYCRTFSGDLLYINKDNLYKAQDIENSGNWNVSLMPAGSYMYAWQDRDKIASYETVKSNVGSDIPVNSKEIKAYFFKTMSKAYVCPDGQHIFFGGYSFPVKAIADRYNMMRGNEAAFDTSAEWVRNLTSSWLNGRADATGKYPFVLYSNDGGDTFNILPVINYVDSSVFQSDNDFKVDYFSYDSVTNSLLAYVKNGEAYESKQIVISFDPVTGDVIPTATEYKQMSTVPMGEVHILSSKDEQISYASGALGYGVDSISPSTFNFDYTSSSPVTIPAGLKVVSVDDAIKLNKGLGTDITSGSVRVLVALHTKDDIKDPFEFMSYSDDYIKSNGDFKVATVEEVTSYKEADRVFSPAYFSAESNAYPKVDDDTYALYYEYVDVSVSDSGEREDGYEVKYLENAYGNNIKLCSEKGSELLVKNELYSIYELMSMGLSELDADIAGKPKFSIDDLENHTEAMEEDIEFENTKNSLWPDNVTKIDSFDVATAQIQVNFGNNDSRVLERFLNRFGIAESSLDNENDYDGESSNINDTDIIDIADSYVNYVLDIEGSWGSTENPYQSESERFSYKNVGSSSFLFDEKYQAFVLSKRYFTSCVARMSYTFYNGGKGVNVIPKVDVTYDREDEDHCYLSKAFYNPTQMFLNPLGYGGIRNLDESDYYLSSPWSRDKAAFTDKLLCNSLGEYVYLCDKNGEKVKIYDAINLNESSSIKIDYDTFYSNGYNEVSLDNGVRTYRFYKLQNTEIEQYHSTDYIYPGMRVALRFFKNITKITDVELLNNGLIVNSKGESIMRASIEKSGDDVFLVTDWLDENKSYTHTSTSDLLLCRFRLTYSRKHERQDVNEDGEIVTVTTYKTFTEEVETNFHLVTLKVPFVKEIEDDKTYFFKDLGNDYFYLLNPDTEDSSTMTKKYTFKYEGSKYVVSDEDRKEFEKEEAKIEAREDYQKEAASSSDKLSLRLQYILKDQEWPEHYKTLYSTYKSDMFVLDTGKFSSTNSDVSISTEIDPVFKDIDIEVTMPKNKYNEISVAYNNIPIFNIPMIKIDYEILRENHIVWRDPVTNKITSKGNGEERIELKNLYIGNDVFEGSIENLIISGGISGDSYIKEINSSSEGVSVVSLNDEYVYDNLSPNTIVSGLYGHSIVKAPKYSTFNSLLYNEGSFIKTGKILTNEELNSLQIKESDSSYSSITLTDKVSNDEYNDFKPHYFIFKVLTAANQYVSPENMNNPFYYKELTLNEFKSFSADRVWYNPKGSPGSPIMVGNNIINSENNNSFYTTEYKNYKGHNICICDEEGHYVGYNSNGDSFRLDTDLDGNCSNYVGPGMDERVVSFKPINELCIDWFKNNMFVQGNEVNPFWQVIHISPMIDNKEWVKNIKLYRFIKSDNRQTLSIAPEYPVVNIEEVKQLDTKERYIKYLSSGQIFDIDQGKINLVLSEGTNQYVQFFNNSNGMTLYGLNFKPDSLSSQFDIGITKSSINSNILFSYKVNSKKDEMSQFKDKAIVKVTEMGIFDKSHNLIAYAQFPPIEYRSDSQHLSFTCAIYHGNMTEVKKE